MPYLNLQDTEMEFAILQAIIRTQSGTGSARAVRKEARVPAVIYGAGKEVISVSIEQKEITKLYRAPQFISGVIELNLNDGRSIKVLPKAVQLHPITDLVHHVDFVHLQDQIQKMLIPIVYEGKDRAVGVKRGGFFNIVKRNIPLNCKVGSLPRKITIDVSNMFVGQSLKVTDLDIPVGCEFTGPDNTIIASITGRGSKADSEDNKTGAPTAAAK